MPEYDGRFELEFTYSVTISGAALVHRHSFDVLMEDDYLPGEDWSSMNIFEKSGLYSPLDTFVQDYVDVWSPLLGVGTALQEIILWKYDPEPSEAKIFISAAPTLPVTSFLGTPVAAGAAIFTFRVQGYRYPMRLYVMEGINSSETRVPYGSMAGANLAYANFVVGLTSPIVGRSDNRPIAVIAQNNGQNEVLRRKRFRP